MSPDDMLRAYAERRKTNGSPTVMILRAASNIQVQLQQERWFPQVLVR